MKTKRLTWFLALAGGLFSARAADTPKADFPIPQYGLYIHFGMPTFAKPGQKGQIPASQFAPPAALDVRSWAHTAKEEGMTFAVLTVKHESGFCLWDSADYDYDVGNSPFKGDIIGDFIAACNAEGILPGVHYSIPDAYNEGAARYRGPVPPPYFSLIKKQVTELHTKYPGIRVQIFDDIWRFSPEQFKEISTLVKRLNPDCVILDQNRPPRGPRYNYATIPKGWMWSLNEPLTPAPQLLAAYRRAKAAGESFLLNVSPDREGRIPQNQIAELAEMKKLIANGSTADVQPAAAPPAKPAAATRLKELKQLYDQGLINQEEYNNEVKKIMLSL